MVYKEEESTNRRSKEKGKGTEWHLYYNIICKGPDGVNLVLRCRGTNGHHWMGPYGVYERCSGHGIYNWTRHRSVGLLGSDISPSNSSQKYWRMQFRGQSAIILVTHKMQETKNR